MLLTITTDDLKKQDACRDGLAAFKQYSLESGGDGTSVTLLWNELSSVWTAAVCGTYSPSDEPLEFLEWFVRHILPPARARDCAMRGQFLYGAVLVRADLSFSDLSDCDLRFARLDGACLVGTTLQRADLYGAQLGGANLVSADLRHANLTHCHVSAHQLTSLHIVGATMTPYLAKELQKLLPALRVNPPLLGRTHSNEVQVTYCPFAQEALVSGSGIIDCPNPFTLSAGQELGEVAPTEFVAGP